MRMSLRWCGTKAAVDWYSTLMLTTGTSRKEVGELLQSCSMYIAQQYCFNPRGG